ncbi:MAG: Deoxyribose-phosphate aldolase 1 [Candidatus Anoxychlamydiales bacterium]|nr:Deoxyribose-phosphate aldolase 1 [Candidatus Anoxychlamydiales bacterium]NGX40530.1 Deoxyribose-phosphate aldolase 1 [Candidatus Anoxychlamydiales bacterium]
MDSIAQYIDHTLLKKDASKKEIEKITDEAIKHGFKAVCVFPEFLPIVVKKLHGKKPLPITVVDFPLGEKSPDEKAKETQKAIDLGAKEIDMVMDFMALKNRDFKKVFDGIKAVVDTAKNIPVKVIIETCYLNPLELASACTIAKLAKAKFVKTSTGFAKGGATSQDVLLMKYAVGDDLGVKASGGIKTLEDAKLFIEAGATRIGTSASLQLIKEK